ncbi:MAG: M48 family metallopeptidase, partial [Wenzhouxiangellaceae bacterium]|nr:M48 family metallopeptidase [Wenzhouxiangellaceae bacterium]
MNFFEQQDRARRRTGLLVAAFAAAVAAIVLAVVAVVLAAFGRITAPGVSWSSSTFWQSNFSLVAWTAVITVGIIGLGSLYRSVQLRGGGGRVARELGGTEVHGTTNDPLRRRLLNIVEEMAIASGVPVPEVFVLEHESGINAFAAGWTPSDAAIAVTRGALETLDRHELQGVIAHEFSHVFNGDMRINIRLMGVLFGILVLAVLGRRMLSSMRYSGRNRRAGGVLLLALAVMIIGYIGLFFGRWIQAAVSRQREYLADASAVQFTRSPDGIGGALKKIGASPVGGQLDTEAEEVGHMLFASAVSSRLLATHPPIVERIRRIDPSFSADDFPEIARAMTRSREARRAEAESQVEAEVESASGSRGPGGLPLDPAELVERIGQVGMAEALMAGALLGGIPDPLTRAARSDAWAPEVLVFLLLDADSSIRERQLEMVAGLLGSESEARVRHLHSVAPDLPAAQRLPLMELAFPSLRRRPQREMIEFMRLVDDLVGADERIDVFEYVLGRLLNREMEDAMA